MKRNILVIGYYYRNNLGDDLFIETIPNFFPSCLLEFVTSDNIEKINLNKYDGIVFGGGDLINDYFKNKAKYVKKNFDGPIFAFSIGIPYKELIFKGYLEYYDHVFTRNKEYLGDLSYAIGSKYSHYLPDAVMTYKNIPAVWHNSSNIIGVFLPHSLDTPIIIPKLVSFFNNILRLYPDIKLHFICFDTKETGRNDIIINNIICSNIDILYKDRIVNDKTRYNGEEMMKIIANCKMTICSRFHSHILSILTETPFISLHYANKVELLIKEKDLNDVYCEIENTADAKPKDFNLIDLNKKFDYVYSNLEKINEKLIKIKNKDRFICDNNFQVEKLLLNNDRRKIENCYYVTDNVDKLNIKYGKIISDITGKRLEDSKNLLNREQSEVISRNMIYEITREISSKYVDGTIDNLIEKPEKLREMIDWVWKDKRDSLLASPKFNIKTTCLQNFANIHRSGWKFALDSILSMNSEYGIIMDVYCDATFGWCKDHPCKENGLIPYTSLWTGFFHHTPLGDYSDNNIINSTNSIEFIKSLETCKGLFVLSNYLNSWLKSKLKSLGYPKIPVFTVYHPTNLQGIIKFQIPSEPVLNIVNVGAWLRNSYSIYALNLSKNFRKYKLKGKMMDSYFPPSYINLTLDAVKAKNINPFLHCLYKYIKDNNYFIEDGKDYDPKNVFEIIEKQLSSVTILEHLSNKEYDLLMSNYIVFVDFLDCSAANTLIECIARGNPIIVNKIPAVVEYLGNDYPLYFNHINDIGNILTIDNIKKSELYLKNPEIISRISNETFYDDISKIYLNLY